MSKLELDDFVYTYPDRESENYQNEINSKVELLLLKLPSKSSEPKKGEGFKHQKILSILMSHSDRMLIMWKPGVGKTCGFVGVCEKLKRGGKFKRAYIMTKGNILVNEIKQQIVCSCTDGYYERDARKDINLINAIDKKINEFYEIKSYGSFYRDLASKNDKDLKEIFSDCIFVIDEVQNLRTAKSGVTDTTENFAEKNKWKKQYLRVFELAERTKIILSSATPIINFSHEIVGVMNYILPPGERISTDVNVFKNMSDDKLKEIFKGRVSYVREADTGVDVEYASLENGNIVFNRKMSIFKLQMSKFQTEHYEKIKKRGVIPDQSQASNFIFPDGSFGEVGYENYFTKNVISGELKQHIKDPVKFRKLSPKYFHAVQIIKSKKYPGNCWVFSEFVGPGVILFSECLKINGFEQYIGKPVRKLSGERYCESGTVSFAETKKKKLRYAILTSSNKNRHTSILKFFRSYANRNGDYLKVLIGSPLTEAGISLANVTNVLILSPRWNFSSTYQTLSRAIRSTSHVELIRELKERTHGQQSRIQVRVFLYATVSPESASTSADIHKYNTAFKKEREIRSVTRLLKESAIDCSLTRERNLREFDKDGTEPCDFSLCDYPCEGATEVLAPDYSSFFSLHSEDFLISIKKFVISIIREFGPTTRGKIMDFDQMKDVREKNNDKILDLALASLLENKEIIRDRFGYRVFLNERGGVIFFSKTPATKNDILDDYYAKHKIVTEKKNIAEIVGDLKILENENVKVFDNLEELGSAALGVKIKLYEQMLTGKKTLGAIARYLTKTYGHLVVTTGYSQELVEKVEKLYGERRKGRPPNIGSDPNFAIVVTKKVIEELMKRKDVIVHRISSVSPADNSHAVVSFSASGDNNMRILINGKWRNVLVKTEQPIYEKVFRADDFNRRMKINNNKASAEIGFFGAMSITDGKFRTVKVVENYETIESKRRPRGRECGNDSQLEIASQLLNLYSYIFEIIEGTKYYEFEQKIKILGVSHLKLPVMTKTRAKKIVKPSENENYRILASIISMGKIAVCRNIEENLEALGLIIMIN